MKINKKWIIIGITLMLTTLIFLFLFIQPATTGKTVATGEYRYVPLSQAEIGIVTNTIISTEFISDIPEKDPVALTFFNFDGQGRFWQDGFLIGRDQLLSQGEPSIYLAMHSKYISQLNGNNLCEIIKEANKNGDLAMDSEYGNAKLLIKYAGMLKHRNCFGF
tara:strand:- start:1072 stop:1560 length:489 start_codon:yes stop_codon:yes gene_type:complete